MQRTARSILNCCRMAIGIVGELQATSGTALPSQHFILAENMLRWAVAGPLNESWSSSMNVHRRDLHNGCYISSQTSQSISLRGYSTVSEAVEEHDEKHSCWNCETILEKKNFFCGGCGRIQALAGDSDFFTLFG